MPIKISVIDYNAGNLGSIEKALRFIGAEPKITNIIDEILDSDGVILPGVGAFGNCMNNFKEAGFIENKLFAKIEKNKLPFLGICLGFQMLFDQSEEMGLHKGLGIIKGKILRFPENVKCPQIGWNTIIKKQPLSFFFEGIPDNSYFYFVHSYYASCEDNNDNLAETNYGGTVFPSVIQKDHILGTQFHPEKSGKIGLKMLKNFLNLTRK